MFYSGFPYAQHAGTRNILYKLKFVLQQLVQVGAQVKDKH